MSKVEFPRLKLKSELRMSVERVVELYKLFEDNGIQIWIDGGWGVDALLGEQTREHADLDIVVQKKDIPKLRELLEPLGYKDVERDDTSERNFILGDGVGEIDVHVVRIDENGTGIYNEEKNEHFPAGSLTGTGLINNTKVRCISPEWVVKFHSGYQLKETDFHDIKAICEKFQIPLPQEYR